MTKAEMLALANRIASLAGRSSNEYDRVSCLEAATTLRLAAQAAAPGGEAVAWLVLSEETGNTRIWWRDKERAELWAAKHDEKLIPLYPAARSLGEAATPPKHLATAIAEYARDIRRNVSGGDDYPWATMHAVADSLEEVLNYSGGAESPLHDEYVMDRAKAALATFSDGAAKVPTPHTALADELETLCCAETEGKFFDCVTDNIGTIIRALRGVAQPAGEAREKEITRLATIEECAQVAEAQAQTFLSPQYAANQPHGSFCERFACEEVAKAIRCLSIPSADREGK